MYLLCNRRYSSEIELNRKNKDVENLLDGAAYCIVQAPRDPLISRDLWEMAQVVRREKANPFPCLLYTSPSPRDS